MLFDRMWFVDTQQSSEEPLGLRHTSVWQSTTPPLPTLNPSSALRHRHRSFNGRLIIAHPELHPKVCRRIPKNRSLRKRKRKRTMPSQWERQPPAI
mmetsp:Transcript_42063/g.105033  ORF Transcript_42063/g.105033 Transcript_42063/m.105033 type:complete len:96 (-) Transcript_42063:1124-1411(-)